MPVGRRRRRAASPGSAPTCSVRGWTPAGEIVYVTTQGQPFFRNHQAFAVAPERRPARAARRSARSTTSRSATAAASRSAATPTTRRAGSATAAARAGAIWIDAEGSGTFRRLTRARRQRHRADVDRRSPLLPRRRRRRRQPLFVPARRQRRAPPHRPRRLLRAPARRATARRIVYACGARLWRVRSRRATATRELGDRDAGAPHPGGAPLRRAGRAPRVGSASIRAGHIARGRRARPAVRDAALGRRGDAAVDDAAHARPAAGDARPTPPCACAAASGSPTGDDGRGERRVGRGARSSSSTHGAARTLPWDIGHVSRAASPRRVGSASRSPTTATRSGSATSRAAR